MSSDDASAKPEVGRLIDQLSFVGVNLGDLATGDNYSSFPPMHWTK